MKRITITLALTALASLAACAKHESQASAKPVKPAPVTTVPERAPVPTPSTPPPPTANPTPPPLTTPLQTTPPPVTSPPVTTPPPNDGTLQERAQQLYNDTVDTTQAKVRDFRESFQDLERKIDEKGDQAPQTWNDIRTNLRTKLDAADAKFDTWRAAASEQWDNFKSEMSKMVDDLSNSIDDAKKKIQG